MKLYGSADSIRSNESLLELDKFKYSGGPVEKHLLELNRHISQPWSYSSVFKPK